MPVETATPELPVPRRWSLQVLGRFRLTDAAGAEIALPGRLDRALLAILALHGQRWLPRSKLAGLLWPAVAEPLRSLSVSLNKLRNALGDSDGTIILRDSDPVITNFGAMDVDAVEFERLAAEESPEALARAEAIYAGELLEGFAIQGEEFEDWLTVERTRLRDRLIEVLSRLQRLRAGAGETDKAIETAQRLLRYDILHEESHRLLMRLQQRAGRRWAALKVAHSCEDALRRENVVPEPETRRLIEEIRRSYEPPGLTVAVPLRTLTEDETRAVELPDSALGRPEVASSELPANLLTEESAGQAVLTSAETAAAHGGPSRAVRAGVLQNRGGEPTSAAHASVATETKRSASPESSSRSRFESTVWLRQRWLLIIVAAILIPVLSTLGYYHWRYWNIPWLAPNPIDDTIIAIKAILPHPLPSSIAVLPFASPGGDAAAETLAQGLSVEITKALARVSDGKVIAAASMQAYGPSPPDLRAVAADLKVDYLLLGNVRHSGDQLRVQVALVEGQEGRQVWGKSYPGQTSDLFAVQDQITFDSMNEVHDALTASVMQRLTATHGTRNLEAWIEASEALKFLHHVTPEDNARARLHYRRAIALDPSYAGGYEGLAWTHLLDAEFSWTSAATESLSEAQRLTERALELNPEKSQLYSLRGHLNLLLRRFDEAERDGERAVEAERNDADAPALLAFTLTYTGAPNRAIGLMERAIELNPRHPAWYGWALGRAYRLAGDPDRAVEILEANLPERPASIIPLVELVIAYGEAGDKVRASVIGALIREQVPHFTISGWAAMQPYEDPGMTQRDAAALRAAGLPD